MKRVEKSPQDRTNMKQRLFNGAIDDNWRKPDPTNSPRGRAFAARLATAQAANEL